MSHKREQVERTADRIRDELLVTLHELDRRRVQATDLGYQVRRHSTAAALTGLGLIGLISGAVAYVSYRARHRELHRAERRWEGLQRAWHHPERLAVRSEDRPLPFELAKKLGLAVGLAFGTQLAKKVAQALLPTGSAATGSRAGGR